MAAGVVKGFVVTIIEGLESLEFVFPSSLNWDNIILTKIEEVHVFFGMGDSDAGSEVVKLHFQFLCLLIKSIII